MRPRSAPFRWLLAVCAAALLPACADQSLVDAGPQPPPVEGPAATKLTCTVSVRAGAMSCGPQANDAARLNVILGGQGVYVRLASSGTSWDSGTQVLRSDVTVENLLSQAMGTPDGTTLEGVRVFFHSGPTVTEGTGTVTVANADGTGTFTAGAQPFFLYNEILDPQETSAPRTWQFNVPATVEQFSFTVLVDAPLPLEHGVLRWIQVHGGGDPEGTAGLSLSSVWTPDGSRFFVAGSYNSGGGAASVAVILFSENGGRDWRRMEIPGGTGLFFADVWGSALDDVYAVGSRQNAATGNHEGVIAHFDGTSWTLTPSPGPTFRFLRSVWGSGPNDVFVVGEQWNDRMQGVILHFDGTSWTEVISDGGAGSGLNRSLTAVWGTGPSDVWAVGYEENLRAGQTFTTAMHYDGTTWTLKPSPYASPGKLRGVWAASADSLFAVGEAGNSALVLRSTDGGESWTPALSTGPTKRRLSDVWGADGSTVYAVGADGDHNQGLFTAYDGVILAFNGSTWIPMEGGAGYNLLGVFGRSRTAVYIAGHEDLVLFGTR